MFRLRRKYPLNAESIQEEGGDEQMDSPSKRHTESKALHWSVNMKTKETHHTLDVIPRRALAPVIRVHRDILVESRYEYEADSEYESENTANERSSDNSE